MSQVLTKRQINLGRICRAVAAIGLLVTASCTTNAQAENAASLPTPMTAGEKPNIIVILSDDAGYGDFSNFGDQNFSTPNIEKLAKQGIRFEQGYVSAAVCSPSRAGLLTGRYQQRFGHEANLPQRPQPGDNEETSGLPVSEITLADALKEQGYYTGIIGKWHLGRAEHFHPLNRGFDEFYGLMAGSRSYWDINRQRTGQHAIQRNGEYEPFDGYLTDRFGDEAIDFIDRNKEKPFFLYLSYTAVHAPMDAKPGEAEKYTSIADKKRRKLAAMTDALDKSVGEVLAAIDDAGIADNTIVFFLNDNGGAEANASSNAPLSGHKGTVLEGGLRVPFIMRWPDKIKQPRDYAAPVISLDIFATAMTAAGGEMADDRKYDGVDLIPFVTGKEASRPHDTLYWRRGGYSAMRDGDWKMIRLRDRLPLLYNISTDEGEQRDLASQNLGRVQRMLKRYNDWESELANPLWSVSPNWQNPRRKKVYQEIEYSDKSSTE